MSKRLLYYLFINYYYYVRLRLKGYWRTRTHWSQGHTSSCTAPWGQRWSLTTKGHAETRKRKDSVSTANILIEKSSVCIVWKIERNLTRFPTHPQSVIVDNDQGKLVPLIDLVLRSNKHLNHLLANVQGVRLWSERTNNQITAQEQMSHCKQNNDDYVSMLYPLKDSNFGNDISSERSRQMI